METIEYLMADVRKGPDAGLFPALRGQPGTAVFSWHGAQVRLHCVPGAWLEAGTEKNGGSRKGGGREALRRRLLAGKLDRYLHSGLLPTEGLWIAPELEPFFPGYEQPFPGPALAARILRGQPFRQILTVLLDAESEAQEDGLWLERFLELCYADLNGLYLVRDRAREAGGVQGTEGIRGSGRIREESGNRDFFAWIYAQSGLPACFTDRLPETDGRKTAVVDLRRKARPPLREMGFGSLYLDMTSQPSRRRLMGERRPDISCVSARNYLDTAFKARYNAI